MTIDYSSSGDPSWVNIVKGPTDKIGFDPIIRIGKIVVKKILDSSLLDTDKIFPGGAIRKVKIVDYPEPALDGEYDTNDLQDLMEEQLMK